VYPVVASLVAWEFIDGLTMALTVVAIVAAAYAFLGWLDIRADDFIEGLYDYQSARDYATARNRVLHTD
jgi:hypothetical protein